MKVITVANTKGGAGKSTTSMYLATAAVRSGRTTVVLDADPQGTASDWAYSVADDGDQLGFEVRPVNRAGLDHLAGDEDLVIIDTPPGADGIVQTAIEVAGFVVVPTRASSADVWRTLPTVTVVGDRPYGILVTQARTGTTNLRDLQELLTNQDLSWFEDPIPLREAITSAVGTVPSDLWGYDRVLDQIMKAMG